MKNKQPAAEPLPQRIAIVASHPYKFMDDLCEAYVKGYRVDMNGLIVMTAPSSFLVEMVLPEAVQ